MALQFTATAGQYLGWADAGLTNGTPSTLAAWCYEDTPTANYRGVIKLDATVGGDAVYLLSHSGVLKAGSIDQGVIDSTSGPGTPGTGIYFHFAGTFGSTTNRTGYLNGTAGSTVTNSANPTGIDQFLVSWSIGGIPWKGRLAAIAMWRVVLTAAEITSLAKGFSPRRVRPQSLYVYLPLIRDVQELTRAPTITYGAGVPSAANHHRQYGY